MRLSICDAPMPEYMASSSSCPEHLGTFNRQSCWENAEVLELDENARWCKRLEVEIRYECQASEINGEIGVSRHAPVLLNNVLLRWEVLQSSAMKFLVLVGFADQRFLEPWRGTRRDLRLFLLWQTRCM